MSKEDYDEFEGIGNTGIVDHVAIQTATGMIHGATMLFRKLGFKVDPERIIKGEWGIAVFLTKIGQGSIDIQLTDATDTSSVSTGENHVAIMVDDPKTVSQSIQKWGVRIGQPVTIEEVPGDKYFVTMAGLITTAIELVPNPLACSKCRGKGSTREGLFEGQGQDVKCDVCKGYGYELDI